MDGCNDRAIKCALVSEQLLSLFTRSSLQELIELLPKALPHFVRGPIGEGDGDDLIDGKIVFEQDVKIALDEHRGLARSRPGRH